MNPIYWKEFIADSGRSYHCSFYPRASAFDSVQPFPGMVELPDTVLRSSGVILSEFDTIPYGFSETSSFSITINLTKAPTIFRNRCLENSANTLPFVVVVRASVSQHPPYLLWESKAVFCGVMKRIPTSTIRCTEQGEEVMEILFVDLFRFLSESVSLTAEVEELTYETVDRLYVSFFSAGFATNGYFEFGGPKAPFHNDERNWDTKAHLCSLNEYIDSRIAAMEGMLQKMLFSESATIERSAFPWEGEILSFYRSPLTQEHTYGAVCTNPYMIGKITKPPHDSGSIVGGVLFDEQGFQRFTTTYDFLRLLTEQMGSTYSSNFEWASGTLLMNWNLIYSPATVVLPSNILDEGREIEFGAGSLRSVRVHYSPEQQGTTSFTTRSIVGAEAEQDFDIEVFLHSQPQFGGKISKVYPVEQPIPSTMLPQPWKMNLFTVAVDNPDIDRISGYSYNAETSTMEAGEGFLYGSLYSFESHSAFVPSQVAVRLHESVSIAISNEQLFTSPTVGTISANHSFESYINKAYHQSGLGITLCNAFAGAFLRNNSSHLRFRTSNLLPTEIGNRFEPFSLTSLGFSEELSDRLSTSFAVVLSCEHSLETGISSVTVFIQGA